jgi:hypothetical protein
MDINSRSLKRFFDVINSEQKDNTVDEPMEIGIVTNLSPLTIEVGGLPLYTSNLYINKYLLAWDENVTITYGDNTSQSVIHHPSKFQVGYYVGLYGLEWNEAGKTYQKYHVIDIIN